MKLRLKRIKLDLLIGMAGAVLYGHQPAEIGSRIARYSCGFRNTAHFYAYNLAQYDTFFYLLPCCHLTGAVLYGHQPAEIGSRIARYSYGFRNTAHFDPRLHDQSRVHMVRCWTRILRFNLNLKLTIFPTDLH